MDNMEKLIKIAEEFQKWLVDTSESFGIAEDELQEIIKNFL